MRGRKGTLNQNCRFCPQRDDSLACNIAPPTAMRLRPFQQKFVSGATAPGIDTGVLSLARGNGKSWLAAHILTRCLTPGDPLHVTGAEYLLCAASLEQARLAYLFCRADLEPTGEYRFLDSVTRIGICHKATNTRLRVMSSKAKSAFGIVHCPLLVGDEPGCWETVNGQLMADAIQTAQGKPGSSMRVVLIGTLAPSTGGWWHDLVDGGSHGSTFVQAIRGDPKRWASWAEIKRCNPLTAISAPFRAKLIDERNAARRDSRLKARFCSYRLNSPQGDESTMLLTVADFEDMVKRPVPPREGLPIVALDLGSNRAWSAALAIYENGRIEARAVAPGIPGLAAQEERDGVARGTYQALAYQGVLVQATGLRVTPPKKLIELIAEAWGPPSELICDRFRIAELHDAGVPCLVTARVSRWSEASFDIRALRSKVKDGPFAVAPDSRSLIAASLAVAMVKNDDQGSVRLAKRGTNNCSRDDVSAAFVLAAGLFSRAASAPRFTISQVPF